MFTLPRLVVRIVGLLSGIIINLETIENPSGSKVCLRNELLPMCPEYAERAEVPFRKRAAGSAARLG